MPVRCSGFFTPLEVFGDSSQRDGVTSWQMLLGGRFVSSIDHGRKLRFARPDGYDEMPAAWKDPVRPPYQAWC